MLQERGYKPIKDIVRDVLKDLDLEKRLDEATVFEKWDDIVGKEISKHAFPDKVYKNVLYIKVDNSAWMAELNTFFKAKMLSSLKKHTGLKKIKDIKFRIADFGTKEDGR
ncbi:DUF721 domain-containing protein [bacterium]|jgi:predicted nucleic acid-binding Zn ribbon protein|nr:DUF721 domain-containing protein [bacterium]